MLSFRLPPLIRHLNKYYWVCSREFLRVYTTNFEIHSYNSNPHAKMSKWEAHGLFPDPDLSQNWQFSCNKSLFDFFFNWISLFCSTKIAGEELRMLWRILEVKALICNSWPSWIWITWVHINAGSLDILLLELVIVLSGGRKNTSSLRQPIINTMSLLFEIFIINFSNILWFKRLKNLIELNYF